MRTASINTLVEIHNNRFVDVQVNDETVDTLALIEREILDTEE